MVVNINILLYIWGEKRYNKRKKSSFNILTHLIRFLRRGCFFLHSSGERGKLLRKKGESSSLFSKVTQNQDPLIPLAPLTPLTGDPQTLLLGYLYYIIRNIF